MDVNAGFGGEWQAFAREESPCAGYVSLPIEESSTERCTGGSPDSQKEFLEALSIDDRRKVHDRHARKQPPVANSFALGYTYHDVLDADHEGIQTGSFEQDWGSRY